MRIALLGAGIIGTVVGRDLAAWDQPDEVVVGDLDGERAAGVGAELGFESAAVDVRDPDSLDAFLRGADVVVNAAQYEVNLPVMEGALRAGAHYTDLGGLFFTTRKQLLLDDKFRDAGLTAVLGIGSCPGIANIHAGDLADRMDTVKSVIIYNGATVDPSESLKWPYSLWTIFDEIVERPMVFRGGEFMDVDPLSEEEMFPFKEPIGYQKAHLSLHSEVATIPLSLADKGIEACEFKIHFFGFPEAALRKLQFLASLGLASTELALGRRRGRGGAPQAAGGSAGGTPARPAPARRVQGHRHGGGGHQGRRPGGDAARHDRLALGGAEGVRRDHGGRLPGGDRRQVAGIRPDRGQGGAAPGDLDRTRSRSTRNWPSAAPRPR